jgi:Ca2+-binding EF-hand superfamily protein
MKRYSRQRIIGYGVGVLLCLLGGSVALNAQQPQSITIAAPGGGSGQTVTVAGGVGVSGRTGGQFGLAINGFDIGSILLKTCDLNQDGKVTLAELKVVASACFKLWDTNSDGSLSRDELSGALKALFPAPPAGGFQAVRVVNGVAVQVPPDELPTPDKQLTRHIMALADSNKDGALSLQELNDFLDKSFSQWDQNGDGALDAQELAATFGWLAMPDPPQ